MLSCIINLDTRAQRKQMEAHNAGVTCTDLLVSNIENKKKFFADFEHEMIAYVDVHEPVPPFALTRLNELCDCVVLRKHSRYYRGANPFNVFNDITYLQALSQARGEVVAHFDMDSACFARDKRAVERWLAHLETHAFVSYPSPCSPKAVFDESFGRHTWASTRAFACRREALKFDEWEAGLREPNTIYDKYGHPPRKCPWSEHLLSHINNESVIYPPRQDEQLLMFCFSRYHDGVLGKLNEMGFDEVLNYVQRCGNLHYPNDLDAQPL